MEFVPIEQAKSMSGLRLVVAKGVWAAWSECAKNIFHVKNIPYTAVAQYGWQENEELVAWTGVRNQPQAIYNEEPVRTSWLDILNLAERLEPEPALLPQNSADRALVVGISNELCGEWGIAWCRRLQMSENVPENAAKIIARDYGLNRTTLEAAEARAAEIVTMIGHRLRKQEKAGSKYLVGQQLTAADIYWACFSNMIGTLPALGIVHRPSIKEQFDNPGEKLTAAIDPIVLEHREYIFQTYLPLPADFS